MFIDKLIVVIGHFFKGLFSASEKTWKKLAPEVKDAMLHGSAIVDVINNNLDKSPYILIALLREKYPDLSQEKMHQGLQQVVTALKVAERFIDPDLETCIKLLQKYLAGLKG